VAGPPADLDAFVRWLQERSGERTRDDFAYRAGVRSEQLSRWASGAGMSGRNLLKLIRAAGVLDEGATGSARVEVSAEDVRAFVDGVQELPTLLDELRDERERLHQQRQQLEARVSALEQRRAAGEQR